MEWTEYTKLSLKHNDQCFVKLSSYLKTVFVRQQNRRLQCMYTTALTHYTPINHIGEKPNKGQFFRACLLRYRSIESVL